MNIFHPKVPQESVIWRYMDFSKFVDLIDLQRLCFTRLNELRKVDPYEGSFIAFHPDYKDGQSSNLIEEPDKGLSKDYFVNCWHLSDIESAALWKVFSNSNECIAIKSTIYNLIESFDHSIELCDTSIVIREVEYGHEKVRERKEIVKRKIGK